MSRDRYVQRSDAVGDDANRVRIIKADGEMEELTSHAAVAHFADYYRHFENTLRSLEKEHSNPIGAHILLERLNLRTQRLWRYLHSHYDIDADYPGRLPSWLILTPAEKETIRWSLWEYTVWRAALYQAEIDTRQKTGVDADKAFVSAVIGIMRSALVISAGVDTTDALTLERRTSAAFELSGWAASALSFTRNPDLEKSLSTTAGHDPEAIRRVAYEQLPGISIEAWNDLDKRDDRIVGGVTSLRTRIANYLAADMPEPARINKNLKKPAGEYLTDRHDTLPQVVSDDLHLQEAAQAAWAAAQRFRLPQREAEILALKYEGLVLGLHEGKGYTSREIGDKLGIPEKQVNVHWYRIRRKIRKEEAKKAS